jgi:hypothetical protein
MDNLQSKKAQKYFERATKQSSQQPTFGPSLKLGPMQEVPFLDMTSLFKKIEIDEIIVDIPRKEMEEYERPNNNEN